MAITEPICECERVVYEHVHIPVFIENKPLEKENAQLKRELAALRAEVFRLRRQGKR